MKSNTDKIAYFCGIDYESMDKVYFAINFKDVDFGTDYIDVVDYLDSIDKSDIISEYNLHSIVDYSIYNLEPRKLVSSCKQNSFMAKNDKDIFKQTIELEPIQEVSTKYKKINTILFENYNLLADDTHKWVSAIDENYKMVNSETKDYDISDDLHFFAMLINPDLKNICTSSAFITNMDFRACQRFGKLNKNNMWDEDCFKQLEYFSWMLREALCYRNRTSMQPISLNINYIGCSEFLDDVNRNYLGKDVKTYLKLMLRQQEGDIILNIFRDHKLIKTIKTEEQLNFTHE